MVLFAWLIALFFALNIGASGTAAAMGSAYGSGAIGKRWIALAVAGVCVWLGAMLGGGAVVKTLSVGLVPSHFVHVGATVVILSAACLTLFVANFLSVPLSTSEVTVGAVVGLGVAYRTIYVGKLLAILAVWAAFPFMAYMVAFMLGLLIRRMQARFLQHPRWQLVQRVFRVLVIVLGCYEAFSAGMNNVANSVGPLVAAGIISSHSAIVLGAIFVGLGAATFGGRVLETNAKNITNLSVMQGSAVSFTGGTLVMIASLLGLPVPLTQATTMAIMGVGTSQLGSGLWRQRIVQKVIQVWIVSPASALLVSYLLAETCLLHNGYAVVVVVCAMIMTLGYFGVYHNVRKHKAQIAERPVAEQANYVRKL